MSSLKSTNYIIWIDLEMTGLDLERDRILEMACIITDSCFNVVAKGPNLVVHEPDNVLEAMNNWCKEVHKKTGLIEAVRKSIYTLEQVEIEMLKFIKLFCPQRCCPLAGNTIYMDRLFLQKYMPSINEYAHYRVIDVSTIKELCKRWNKKIFDLAPPKKSVHRSLSDIEESISEMKYYRDTFFVLNNYE